MGTKSSEAKSSEKTQLHLPSGTLLRIKAAADSVGLSQSAWVRQAIFLALMENERRRGISGES